MIQRSLILLKPDALERGIIGEIITRFERVGASIVGMKLLVSEKDIGGDYESIWQRARMAYGKGAMPRTLNFITGPSRSGDIEQTMLLGAHGPRRLHIIVIAG